MSDDEETILSGGMATKVTRRGDVVFRTPKPQSSTVLSFLTFLSGVGFPASPRPIGNGFASDGREMFEFIEGSSPQPFAWSDQACFEIGDLLRTLHGLSVEWIPPPHALWRPWFARDLTGERSVIGHGDLGPWNILARDGHPVAFIDWDNAGPVGPMWELAHVVWQNAQLYDDDVSGLNHLPDATERAAQAKLILDGYRLDHAARGGFVDRMIQMAIWSAREEAINHDVNAESVSPTQSGYPILWAVTWRARSAAWMLDHRQMLQSVLDT
ncbi:MAG TPA: phosphotransferase [Acidimicrobiales bacterium]|nr:phosphotransferase [Acidimicrobiales bacterium]